MVGLITLLSFCSFSLETSETNIYPKTTQDKSIAVHKFSVYTDSITHYSEKFSQLVVLIRDGKIEKHRAKKEASVLLARLKRLYTKQSSFAKTERVAFPIQGYKANAIGGTNGEGYKPGSYNFYDGNRHTGHPAHDIFINDRDQNCLDDRTGKPVTIISFSDGIVVATQSIWHSSSNLRGGIYVVVYSPLDDMLYYYAHNNNLLVKPGVLVSPGDAIAELGRSGLNAFKKRSPTHLHLMALKINANGNLVPVDLYPVLKAMR